METLELPKCKVKLKGLGGWLVLVAIGMFVTLLLSFVNVAGLMAFLFDNGKWASRTNSADANYVASFGFFAGLDIALTFLLLLASAILIYLFFAKKRLFPKLFIVATVCTMAFVFLDAYVYSLAMPDEPMIDPSTMQGVFRSFVACAIWIPYMIRSARVRNTFTR